MKHRRAAAAAVRRPEVVLPVEVLPMSEGVLLMLGVDTVDDPRVTDDSMNDPEIVEIAATKLDVRTFERVSTYHSWVRPVVHAGHPAWTGLHEHPCADAILRARGFAQARSELLQWAGDHVMAWMTTAQDRLLWRRQGRRAGWDPDVPWPFIDLSRLFAGLADVQTARCAFATGWIAHQERCAANRLPYGALEQTCYIAEFLVSQTDLRRQLDCEAAKFHLPALPWLRGGA